MTPQDTDLRRELNGYLSHHNVLTLAYHDAAGVGACAVWFAVDSDLVCYFLSAPSTRHGLALRDGGDVAVTVQQDEQDWHEIRGVQGLGFCGTVPSEHRESAWRTYSSRFPFVIKPFGSIAAALGTVTLWSIKPRWLRLIDNTKGFGHKEELVIETGLV